MADSNHLKHIAIVGASGNVGTEAVRCLLEIGQSNITVISHTGSSATFPESPLVTVKRGSYDDASFLESALSGQDALLIALGFMAMGEQGKLIKAAAQANVKWILPTEYAGDGNNHAMMEAVPLFHGKVAARKQIEELSKTHEGLKWIGVATNPWTEFSMRMGMFGINAFERKATLYTDSGSFNSSTLPQVGLGIARLLSLPIVDESNPRKSLQHYANNFVYISSFLTSQQQLFASAQKATGTSEADWSIERATIEDWIKAGREGMAKRDMRAGAGLTYANYMGEGKGGNYEARAKEDRDVLGLHEENIDEVMVRVLAEGQKAKAF